MPPKVKMYLQEENNQAIRKPEEEMKGDGLTEAVGAAKA
jgi:hypothetical protein